MLRLLPPRCDSRTTSPAERAVFCALSATSGRGIVLHSLHLPKHSTQVQGEADFLLIAPRGLLCIEVKGGPVSQQDGVWHFGHRRERDRSPFSQAEANALTIAGILRTHPGRPPPFPVDCLVGYGVIFPDITFDLARAGDSSVVPEVLLDHRHGLGDLGAYLTRCFDYWEQRIGRRTPLTGEQMNAVRQLLRGNFDFVPQIGYWIEETERRLRQEETDETQRYLDVIDEEPRIILRGVAGSGKTTLSLEYARRRVLAGDSVLYVCFNKNLRGFLEGSVDRRVHLWTFHDLLDADLPAGRRPERPQDPGALGEYYEHALPEAYREFAEETGRQSRFDCLVVDEGQDLLRPAYARCMDLMLNGGLASGRWQICYDPGQDIYSRDSAEMVKQLRGQVSCHTYRLRVNCRNTSAIAVYNKLLTGIDCGRPRLKLFRPEVKVQFYETGPEEVELVRRTIDDLRRGGARPREIVLLGGHTMRNSCLRGDAGALGADLPVLELGSELTRAKLDQDIVKYCTIWGFKGIDAPVVLLVDVADLADRNLLHTGISRARTALYVFIRADRRAEHDARAGGYVELLRAAMAESMSKPLPAGGRQGWPG